MGKQRFKIRCGFLIHLSLISGSLFFALLNFTFASSISSANIIDQSSYLRVQSPWSVTFKSASAMSAFAQPTSNSLQNTNNVQNVDASSITRDEINAVAREIWCPLCSGVRLDVCDLQACEQMREEIAIQLAQGAETEEIKSYFLAQYGPQILGEPPRSGFNWLAWIVPFVALFGVGLYLFLSRRPQAQPVHGAVADTSSANANIANPGSSGGQEFLDDNGAAQEPEQGSGASQSDIDYERLLDRELEQYE